MNRIDPLKLQKKLGKRYFKPKIGPSKQFLKHRALVPKLGIGYNPRQQIRINVPSDKNDTDSDSDEAPVTKKPPPLSFFDPGEFGLGSVVKSEEKPLKMTEAISEHGRQQIRLYGLTDEPLPKVGESMRTSLVWGGQKIDVKWYQYHINEIIKARAARSKGVEFFEG